MREAMTMGIDARVVLGGKTAGYQGRWPGILEEAYLALSAGHPLYVAGGRGGAAAVAVDLLKGRTDADVELADVAELRAGFGDAELRNGLTERSYSRCPTSTSSSR